MDNVRDVLTWATEEFGDAKLGNALRTERLVLMGARAAQLPGGTVTAVFTDPAEREGAFRWLENDKVSVEGIQHSAHSATARRCRDAEFAWAPVDQTSVNLTDRTGKKGFGAVGRGKDKALGLQVMTAIAVTPDGTPQGVAAQNYWARHRRGKKKRPQDRDRQRAEDKETERWRQSMRQARDTFAAHAPSTRLWFQLDRGGDAWPILDEFANDPRVELTVRAAWDRRLWTEPGEPQRYLWETVERFEVMGDFLLDVPPGPNRTARCALIQIRAGRVTLDIRDKRTGRRHRQEMNVVLAQEQGTTPSGERPIEWMLLTNHPVDTLQDAHDVVLGYAQRWRIENFHQTWKSGACNVEQTQLRDAENVIRWATILASVAMRIQRLMHLARTQPDQPATVEFTQPEIDAVIASRKPKGYQSGDVPPLVEVVRWIAEEGGYTGRSSGGPPGAKVLARGLDRLQLLFRVFTAQAATGRKR